MSASLSNPVLDQAIDLVKTAQGMNIQLRLLGSTAVLYLADSLSQNRPAPIKDIDLITHRSARKETQRFLISRGWVIAQELLMFIESRETYSSPGKEYTIDVYYDLIDGNHPIDLRDRLEMSFPTVSWTDLLLSKLQRRSFRVEDTWDCCSLFRRPNLDVPYFCKVLGDNWGLFTSVMDNLVRLEGLCGASHDVVSNIIVKAKGCRKTVRWFVRSIVGRRIKWWREMSEASIFQE